MVVGKYRKNQVLHFFHFVHCVLKDFCPSANKQLLEANPLAVLTACILFQHVLVLL